MRGRRSGSGSLTDVPGVRVGHATDPVGVTGCTVILCEKGAVGGVDVRGAASGTRELAVLEPGHVAPVVHGLVLAGGSAFGLDAAGGVMRYLEERGVGYPMAAARVPIVAAAILYDLGVGDSRARPDADMGYAAAEGATRNPVAEAASVRAPARRWASCLERRVRAREGSGQRAFGSQLAWSSGPSSLSMRTRR